MRARVQRARTYSFFVITEDTDWHVSPPDHYKAWNKMQNGPMFFFTNSTRTTLLLCNPTARNQALTTQIFEKQNVAIYATI
jgi:hypothetical protein